MLETQHLPKPKDGPAPRWFHVAVAASMVISAIAALIGTLHTGRTMSELVDQNAKLVRAGSTPVLEFDHGNALGDGTAGLEFTVRNVGTGLARVVWFELRIDGQPVKSMGSAIRTVSGPLTSNLTFNTSPVASRTLGAATDTRIFFWRRPDATTPDLLQAWEALDKARFGRLTVEACYCSVFDECWISALDGGPPKKSDGCSTEGRTSLFG